MASVISGKFGRNYILQVEKLDGSTLIVTMPLTIEFDIVRNILSSTNTASIRIYNLNLNNRNAIRKNVTDFGVFRKCTLQAGYGSNLAVVFSGNVTECFSSREGSNMITYVEAKDGGFAFTNSQVNAVFPKGAPHATVLTTMVNSMAGDGIVLGAIGNFQGALTRATSFSGNSADLINQITDGNFFVDNGRANCLNFSEYIIGEVAQISSASGLLGTPKIEQTILSFPMIFEPSLYVGQLANIQSITELNYNGPAKIVGLKHRGTISGAVCGDAQTEVSLFYGLPTLTPVALP